MYTQHIACTHHKASPRGNTLLCIHTTSTTTNFLPYYLQSCNQPKRTLSERLRMHVNCTLLFELFTLIFELIVRLLQTVTHGIIPYPIQNKRKEKCIHKCPPCSTPRAPGQVPYPGPIILFPLIQNTTLLHNIIHSPQRYPIQSGSILLNFFGSTATATRSTTV
jgi:hypothetical protein